MVRPKKGIRASTATALRDLGVRNGLVPAWYDQPAADYNYNTYSQALRILVLAHEPKTAASRTALASAVTAMLNLQIRPREGGADAARRLSRASGSGRSSLIAGGPGGALFGP
jgi:hypothetical protein